MTIRKLTQRALAEIEGAGASITHLKEVGVIRIEIDCTDSEALFNKIISLTKKL